MAFQYYVRIKGVKQGQFVGNTGGEKAERKGIPVMALNPRVASAFEKSSSPSGGPSRIEITGFNFQTVSPLDSGSGSATGKRGHKPITITKETGAATPQLFQAFCTQELLTEVVIGVVTGNRGGPPTETVVPRISLTNALVSNVKRYGAGGPTPSGGGSSGGTSNGRPGKPEPIAQTIRLTNAMIVQYRSSTGSLPGSRGPSGRGLITFVLDYEAISYLPPRG
jgi:type VI protein secretion system component Hcp